MIGFDVGKEIMQTINGLNEPLTRLFDAIELIEDEEQKKEFRKAAALIAGDVEIELSHRLIQANPGLAKLRSHKCR